MGTFWAKLRKNLFAVITIVLTACVMLYFLFSTTGISDLKRIFGTLSPMWLCAAVGAAVGAWLLEGFVLWLLCRRVHPGWSYFYSFTVGMIGLLYGALTPFATGGQPMQIYAMKRMGMDAGTAGSAVALRTVFYQVVMVLYSLVLVVYKLSFFWNTVQNFVFIIILGLASNALFIALVLMFCVSEKTTDRVLLFFLGFLHKVRLCRHPQRRYEKIRGELKLFHDGTRLIGRSAGLYLQASFFTVVQITLTCLIPYFIYRSFHFSGQPAINVISAQAFVSMVSAFVPLPGASGGAEGSFYLLFSMFFTPATIFPAILLWRIISYYANILVGCIFAYVGGRLKPRQLSPQDSLPQ